MPDPISAIGASTGIGLVGSIFGAKESSDASKDAAEAGVQSNRENINFQKWLYQQQKKDAEPWRRLGIEGIGELSTGDFDVTGSEVKNMFNEPGYQFRLAEGEKAINNMMAGGGKYFSGERAKALTRFNQDQASQEFGNAYARLASQKLNKFNRAANKAGIGQTANTMVQDAGSQMGARVGSSIVNTGNVIAQDRINQGNISQNAANNVVSSANQGMENYLLYSLAR